MGEFFIILGLILLNGLFSMAEIALVSARKARLEAQANKGDKRAKEALELANHPDTFLSTVQIGITLIGILTGIYSGEKLKTGLVEFLGRFDAINEYANGIATAIIVIIITYLTLVLGELVPKRIGLSRPEIIAKIVAAPMRAVSFITYPFIWLLTKSTLVIVKLFGIKRADTQVTEEEIKAIIIEGTEQGTIEEAEQEIIERVFHLSDRNITSLMTHRSDIIWFDLNDTEKSIREKILQEPHSVYPVCDGDLDNIKGIVSLKELYLNRSQPGGAKTLKDLMRPPLFVPENITAYRLLERFKKQRIGSCFIVDEYGTLQGMVTLDDILHAIVGGIPQAEDQDYEILKREDGSYLVDAQIPFYNFLSRFDKAEWLTEIEQEFDTLAGFILHQLERIPHAGDKLDWRGFHFEIVDMDAQRIDKVLLNISDEIRQEMEEE